MLAHRSRPRPPRPPIRLRAGVAAVAVATTGHSLPGSAIAQEVAVDTVSIALEGTEAIVRQRIPNLGDRVVALAIRIPGQSLEVTGVVREGRALLDATLREEPEAYRFEVESGAPIVIAYRVSGELRRIPLFVPAGRAELTVAREFEEPYLIRVTGEPTRLDEIDTAISLPRFERLNEGVLEARLSSLPSFVRFSGGGLLSFGRAADLLALAVILLGAWWAWRRLRRRRADAGS